MTYWENVIKEMEENESFITKHPFIGIVIVCLGWFVVGAILALVIK